MSTPVTQGAAPDDAPRTLFRCPELADFLEESFKDEDLNYDDLTVATYTFTPVT